MKNQRLNNYKPLFALFFLVVLLIINTQKAGAQEKLNGSKLSKYELSIDLVPIIDQGQFGTILFKVYNVRQEKIKGAYRFGINANFGSINDPDAKKNSFVSYGYKLIGGYEKHIRIGKAIGYYGIDFRIIKNYTKTNPSNENDQQNIAFEAIPFAGIRHHLNNKLSVSFESGFGGKISYTKTIKEPIHKTLFYGSDIIIPYNVTLNYHF
jgi:hypothetical protein